MMSNLLQALATNGEGLDRHQALYEELGSEECHRSPTTAHLREHQHLFGVDEQLRVSRLNCSRSATERRGDAPKASHMGGRRWQAGVRGCDTEHLFGCGCLLINLCYPFPTVGVQRQRLSVRPIVAFMCTRAKLLCLSTCFCSTAASDVCLFAKTQIPNSPDLGFDCWLITFAITASSPRRDLASPSNRSNE